MVHFISIQFEKNLARITLALPPELNSTQTTPWTVLVTCFERLDGFLVKVTMLQRKLPPDGTHDVLAFDVGEPSALREIRFSAREPITFSS